MTTGEPRSDYVVDVSEHGAGEQTSSRRLYIQLQVFTGSVETTGLAAALGRSGLEGVLYADVTDPRGVGLLTLAEDPTLFTTTLREVLGAEPFAPLRHRRELTMFGRSYSSGFEPDLEDALLRRPRRTALEPLWPWAIWYPLRRLPAFARLPGPEQGAILREHAAVGRAYGEADLAHDIRLACHGLDAHDNDFVIGLIGRDLQPLSHVVQAMRRTAQTAEYIQALGPFFVGHVLWRSRLPASDGGGIPDGYGRGAGRSERPIR